MITELEISNFQSHEYSSLEFAPGTNIILGQSDTGKSSIIRAIHWAIANRPTGDSFRSNFTKESTEVSIAFEEDYVSRQKGKSFNGYSTGQGEYKALRTDVPEEVQAITKMEEVNIQPQHKAYFLLDETPGNVAKAFNSVSGLEEMDSSLKRINSRVRASNSKLTAITTKYAETCVEIEGLNWIGHAKKDLKSIREVEKELQQTRESFSSVVETIEQMEQVQEQYNKLPDFSALPKLEEILKLDETIEGKCSSMNSLIDLVESQGMLEKKLKQCVDILELDLSNTAEIRQRIDALNEKVTDVITATDSINSYQVQMGSISNSITNTLEHISDLESKLEVCPTCGQYIQEEK